MEEEESRLQGKENKRKRERQLGSTSQTLKKKEKKDILKERKVKSPEKNIDEEKQLKLS